MNKEEQYKSFPQGNETTITPEDIKDRFDKIDVILFGVVLAILIGMIALIFAVIAMFWDQMRFNNAAYRDYTNELEIQNQYLESVGKIESKQDDILKKMNEVQPVQTNN